MLSVTPVNVNQTSFKGDLNCIILPYKLKDIREPAEKYYEKIFADLPYSSVIHTGIEPGLGQVVKMITYIMKKASSKPITVKTMENLNSVNTVEDMQKLIDTNYQTVTKQLALDKIV